MAYIRIRNRRVVQHRNMISYSYACCFAAVTLRLWMPFLYAIFGEFQKLRVLRYSLVVLVTQNLATAYVLTGKPAIVAPQQEQAR